MDGVILLKESGLYGRHIYFRYLKIHFGINVNTMLLFHDKGIASFLIKESFHFETICINDINRAVQPVVLSCRLSLLRSFFRKEVRELSILWYLSAPQGRVFGLADGYDREFGLCAEEFVCALNVFFCTERGSRLQKTERVESFAAVDEFGREVDARLKSLSLAADVKSRARVQEDGVSFMIFFAAQD